MCSSLRSLLAAAGLHCLLPTLAVALPPELWNFDPDYSTARPPLESIPPLSRHATDDPSLLKYQILGIVGGYVLTVLFLFTLLLTVGRRLRRAAQSSQGTLSMEMVKPNRWMQDPSPVVKNQGAFQRWPKKTPTESPASSFAPTFDNGVVLSHRAQQEQEMERLYEAVLQNETKAPKSISVKEHEIAAGHAHTRNLSNASKRSFSQRRPPQLANQDQNEHGPTSPRSISSSHQQGGYQMSNNSRYSVQSDASSTKSKSTTASVAASQSRMNKNKNAKSLRKLNISAPMPTNKYPGVEKDEEASTPLSPRYPDQAEALPVPSRERPITPIVDEFDQQESSVTGPYTYEQLDQPRPLPRPAPQRINTNLHDPKSPPPLPPPPKDLSPISANSSANPLPFRQYQSAASVTSLGGPSAGPISPGPTKTTLLSPRRERFGGQSHPAGFIGMNQPSAGLGSAGLATPYSPYMPFTPMTPVTPRIATRAERKQRRKEEGRRVANADQDLVKDEKELWRAGY